jgi:hypothetical protein
MSAQGNALGTLALESVGGLKVQPYRKGKLDVLLRRQFVIIAKA